MSDQTDQRQVRLAKLQALREARRGPSRAPATTGPTHRERASASTKRGQTVAIAGRLLALREHGRSAFADLADASGEVQLFMRQNNLGEDGLAQFVDLDIGDIVGVTGTLMKTRSGEVSVEGTGFTLLAKALRPLPEKFHGLKDPELRYRQRYVDLIVNPDSRRMLEARSRMVAQLRRNSSRSVASGVPDADPPAHLRRRQRPSAHHHHNALDMTLYMHRAGSTSSASSSAASRRSTNSASASATRAWTPATTPSSCSWGLPGIRRLGGHDGG